MQFFLQLLFSLVSSAYSFDYTFRRQNVIRNFKAKSTSSTYIDGKGIVGETKSGNGKYSMLKFDPGTDVLSRLKRFLALY